MKVSNCSLSPIVYSLRISVFSHAFTIDEVSFFRLFLFLSSLNHFLSPGRCTTKTFLFQWSYGVLLWEIFTYGKQPYCGIDNQDILYYLKQGKRLPMPDATNDFMWGLLSHLVVKKCSVWFLSCICKKQLISWNQVITSRKEECSFWNTMEVDMNNYAVLVSSSFFLHVSDMI